MKVLVSGASGRIGNVLVRELLKSGYGVRALVKPGDTALSIQGLDIERVEGDVTVYPSVLDGLKGCEAVFYLAGIVSIIPGREKELYETNIKGAANMADACLECGITRLLYTSSIHALSEPPPGTAFTEEEGYHPSDFPPGYNRSMAQGALEVLKRFSAGLSGVIVCPSGVIGPYDYDPSEMGRVVVDYARGKMSAYVDGGYDFVDVRDVAIGMISAFEKGQDGQSYILSGQYVSIKSLFEILGRLSGLTPPRLRVPYILAKLGAYISYPYYRLTHSAPLFTAYSLDVLRSNSNISSAKARCELGFSPRLAEESLADAYLWFKSKGYLSD
ncbi:SDR family oxidoreductase [Dehalococcoides mccartyi]|jgi:dihydroflavonol-4-reductase|uniref:NAD-dependent epimerase/dehydratase n=1 Tax=Dehalococcoides mccartyi TaxID=61435 RepID=A0A142VBZ8_9CHLR|nr:SDR family oxidoreductase [Dehalococcoides mccartyi]AII61566.1 dihydroflavonol 4-reductase [Dehalococcoides mccartyi CG5]AMU87366.1 NAD-dependent epimerase/dehydratase [Dehalococcoides mccartyi]AOW00011.1 dihydroflavonol-4-reductase [Dehalococcoides mccartyi]MBA2084351.1 Dihydroflavonol-4-reductase [Dehalococcoides mccartyi]QBX64565.1 NAD-dependent epimerase/dehydratase family protein [Dehalococcoides mccartyi]